MRLSPAETMIVERLAAGETTAQIAARRGTSIRTVKAQIAKARERVGARTRCQLVAIFLETRP